MQAREDEALRQETEAAEQGKPVKKRGRRGRRNPLGVGQGVEVRVHRDEIPEAERQCCGETKQPIGEDVTQRNWSVGRRPG